MELAPDVAILIAAIQEGLPLTPRPYADVARQLGWTEDEVLARIRALSDSGVISRFGVIVRHQELGYRANAMVVWDVPDDTVTDAAAALIGLPYVTLCYRRRRVPPAWPYNLFCMIHGRDRTRVEGLAAEAGQAAGLGDCPNAVLFSGRRFKQRGARYGTLPVTSRRRKEAAL